ACTPTCFGRRPAPPSAESSASTWSASGGKHVAAGKRVTASSAAVVRSPRIPLGDQRRPEGMLKAEGSPAEPPHSDGAGMDERGPGARGVIAMRSFRWLFLAILAGHASTPLFAQVPGEREYLDFIRAQAAQLRDADRPPTTREEWEQRRRDLRAKL